MAELDDRTVLQGRPEVSSPAEIAKKEWGTPDHLGDGEASLWSTVRKHEAALRNSNTPGILPNFLGESRSLGTASAPRPSPRHNAPKTQQRMEHYAQVFEQTYYDNGGKVSMDWLYAQDPDDLGLIDFGDTGLMEHLQSVQEEAQWAHERDLAELQAANQRADEEEKSRGRFADFIGAAISSLLPGGTAVGFEATLLGDAAEAAHGAFQKRWEEDGAPVWEKTAWLRDKLPGKPDHLMETFGDALSFWMEKAREGIPALPGSALSSVNFSPEAAVLGAADRYLMARERENYEALIPPDRTDEEYRQLGEQMTQEAAWDMWQKMPEDDPLAYNELLEMGLGNETKAFGIFMSSMTELTPEEQMDIGREIDADFHDQMGEFDYRGSSALLDAIAAYSHHLPMRWATGSMALLFDEEIRSDAFRGDFDSLSEEIARSEHSPAKFFGIDGTVLGIGMDLFMGTIFGPENWFFGPKTAGAVRWASVKNVNKLVKSRGVVRYAEDVAGAIAKGDLGQVAVLTAWLDDPGLVGRVFSITDEAVKTPIGTPKVTLTDAVATGVKKGRIKQMFPRLSKTIDDIAEGRLVEPGYKGAAPDLSPTFTSKTGQYRATSNLPADEGGKTIVTQATDSAGSDVTLTLGHIADTPNYAWMTESGAPVAGITYTDAGATWWVHPSFQGKGNHLATQLLDGIGEAHFFGPDEVARILDRSIGDGSISEAGAKALNREVARFGDDLEPKPTQAFEESIRHDLSINNLDTEAVTEIVREAMMRGAYPPNVHRTTVRPATTSMYAKNDLNKLPIKQWVDQYTAQMPRVTQFELHGPGHWGRITQMVNHVWGADRDGAAHWLGQLTKAKQQKAKLARQRLDDVDYIKSQALAKELEYLDDQLGGGALVAHADDLDAAIPTVDEIRALQERVHGAEKKGGWSDWTPEQRALYDAEDYEGFSRSRGYTEAEIADHQRYMEIMKGLEPDIQVSYPEGSPMAGELAQSVSDEQLLAAGRARASHVQPGKAVVGNIQRRIIEAQDELTNLKRKLGDRYKILDDQRDIDAILQQMYEDYNRKHIATLPGWKNYVNDEGIVPWDTLRGGTVAADEGNAARQFFSDDVIAVAPELEAEAQRLSGIYNTKMTAQMPMPALDMVMASTWGGEKYLRATARNLGKFSKDTLWTMHRLWVIDRVMTPATAAVVSFDELMRIFHKYGHDATTRWVKNRFTNIEARAVAAVKRGKLGTGDASDLLSAKINAKLVDQAEMPTMLKNGERSTFEGMGQGFMDISPGDAGYIDAARRFSGQFIQDPGFRAFMGGEDAFRTWWNDPGVAQTRPHVVNVANPNWEDAYRGWQTIYDYLTKGAKEAGLYNKVDDAWRQAVQRADEIGGNALVELPHFALADLGPVRGVRKVAPNKWGVAQLQETFFEKFFMDPTNSRRGFLHTLAVEYETTRLRKLFADQGKQIVPYEVLAKNLGLRSGVGLDQTIGPVLDDLALKADMVTEGYIRRMAEAHAIDEIQDMMYAWNSGSRMGRQTKAIFPFGGPWADMWGFWGREMLSKPHLRGWVNEGNFFGLGDEVRNFFEATPINPRVPGMVSKLAATDFEIDRGWVPWDGDDQEGLLPGSQSTDLSPLFFMPTGGDTPFQVLFPPLGYLPIGLLDMLITREYDPVDNAKEYQEAIDYLAEWIPGMQFTTGKAVPGAVGGGSFGKVFGMAADTAVMGLGEDAGLTYPVSRFFGDINREVDRTRQLSALMADPENLELLLAATDEDIVDQLIQSFAVDASKQASTTHFFETASRTAFPARTQFDVALDEITDVWVDAAEQFPALKPTYDRVLNLDMSEPENRRIFANDVRKAFFNLDQWQRDLYVGMFPQMAVNLVPSWKWSPSGEEELGREAQTPYRTDGSAEGLARHQSLIDRGLIRPVPPQERAYQILGYMKAAQERVVTEIYSDTAEGINNSLWENTVTPATRDVLQRILDTGFGREHGISDVRTLWENWGSLEKDAERFIGSTTDYTEEQIKEAVSIPTKHKAWSTSWNGISGGSERFKSVTINWFSEKQQEIADGMGVELYPGMTGEQLYTAIDNVLLERGTGPLWNMAEAPQDAYTLERGQEGRTAEQHMRRAAMNPDADPEWRERMWTFLQLAENTRKAVFARPGRATRDEMDLIRSEYNALYGTDPSLAWDHNWKHLYERTFGPLEWEQPQPPTMVTDGNKFGGLAANAYTPLIRKIVDGDTLIVSEPGDKRTHTVRLVGLRAPEYNQDFEAAEAATKRLKDAILAGIDAGQSIHLVRDPDNFGNTDRYGRELAWIFIGGEAYFDDEAFLPTD